MNFPAPPAAGPDATAPRPVLVIGYGSTLRGDDGVGPRVAEAVAAWKLPHVTALDRHQLTPELAEGISRAALVIFVDAAVDLPSDTVDVQTVTPATGHQVMFHTASPGALLNLADAVFGHSPPAWIVRIPVAELGIGESLSPTAQRGVAEALIRVRELLGA